MHERIVDLPPHEYTAEGLRCFEYVDREHTAAAAAQFIAQTIHHDPQALITFATGGTMEPVLAYLSQSGVNASDVQAQHLDEYVGAHPDYDPESFVRFLRQRVFSPLRIQYTHELNGMAASPEAEAERYEAVVSTRPADLVILGIGPGGHIAFNEVDTPFDLGVHVQQLAPETIQRDILRGQPRRDQALTQGPRNIIAGKQIMLVLYGDQKGKWLADCLTGPIDPHYPASVLRLPNVTPRVTVFLDQAAGRILRSC